MVNIAGIIPTLNRHSDLLRLLESTCRIRLIDAINFSLYVVDNSEDGNCEKLVSDYTGKFKCYYLHEPSRGLSNARNKALQSLNNNTDFICTIDDDLILPIDYLSRLSDVLNRNSHLGLLGGRVELYNKNDLPITIKTSIEPTQYQGGTNLFGFVHGCCMIFPVSIIEDIGFFDTKLGAGTSCPSAEDTDYYFRIWTSGLRVLYDPDWFVYHNHGRKTEEERLSLKKNYAIGQGGFLKKYLKIKNGTVLRLFYWDLLADIKIMISFSKKYNIEKSKKYIMKKWYFRFIGFLRY
jgi:GT2 family glycosyltransferase